MFSFKRSLIGLVGLLIIVVAVATLMPLVGRGQGQAPFGQRKFYVTQTTHNGGQALTACAQGYHMASLWEIHDPSNLRYDTTLGLISVDSGFGPPSLTGGWIRTGFPAANGSLGPGEANCQAWTSTNGADVGSQVFLTSFWTSPDLQRVSPWFATSFGCSQAQRVWCVQD